MSQSKISTYRRNRIFACFCRDVTATAAAKLAGVNRNTANYCYGKIRTPMLQASLREGGRETGEFEADESYFGAKRIRGKRGRGQRARPRCSGS
jgi:transposase-like protein